MYRILGICMMTSSNGNIFRVTGHLCGEFTGPRWIPHTKASDAKALMFTLICARMNGWVNNRETGDLRRHRAHYDVIVMVFTRTIDWYTVQTDGNRNVSRVRNCMWLAWLGVINTLQWRHNERYGVSNHQPRDCLLNRLFRRRSKKASKLRVTGLFEESTSSTVEFPAQRASNAENVPIWWRLHDMFGLPHSQWIVGSCNRVVFITFHKYHRQSVPLHIPNGRQFVPFMAVQGGCSTLYQVYVHMMCTHIRYSCQCCIQATCQSFHCVGDNTLSTLRQTGNSYSIPIFFRYWRTILCMHLANERRGYIVIITPSVIGSVHTQNDLRGIGWMYRFLVIASVLTSGSKSSEQETASVPIHNYLL